MTMLQLAARALLVVVFGTALVGKARSRAALAAFAADLAGFRWLPAGLRRSTAVGVIAAELVTVALLATVRQAGAAAALVLLAGFTAATLRAGRAADCRCFGRAKPAARGGAGGFVLRNALLAAGALAAGLAPGGAVAPALAAVALVAGAAAGALVVRWDDIAYLFQGPAAPRRS
ncbi:MauE/DoxX family redox-associated membrane protein [Kitasatospora sp. NPDC048239]|uniref:MauE/DoxX family redox-associated membrane protein n=1 Tax=Kitasatospora sp. NPDC048239 TaxID=3364046 RepID=UPI00372392A1